jgi:hypothetical protein
MTNQQPKALINDAINMFPERDRYLTDSEKQRYIREDIVIRIIEILTKNDSQGILEQPNDIDTVGTCANCGVEFHIHKPKEEKE